MAKLLSAKVKFTTKRPTVVHKTLKSIDAAFTKGTPEWNQAAFMIMDYDKGEEAAIRKGCDVLLKNRGAYEDLAAWALRQTDLEIPWEVIAVVHALECNNDLKGILHNGQRIVGTKKKSTIVPVGVGPFATFYASGQHALKTQSVWKRYKTWDIGSILVMTELWNGAGYLKYHYEENTPYNWAKTSINDGKGKYVRDGKWDANADANGQVGGAALLCELSLRGIYKPLYRVNA